MSFFKYALKEPEDKKEDIRNLKSSTTTERF